jgi:hypothetical protein
LKIRSPLRKLSPIKVNNMELSKSTGCRNAHLRQLAQHTDQLWASYGHSNETSDFLKAAIYSLLTSLKKKTALLHVAAAGVVAMYRTKSAYVRSLCEQITTRVSIIPLNHTSIPRHKCGG